MYTRVVVKPRYPEALSLDGARGVESGNLKRQFLHDGSFETLKPRYTMYTLDTACRVGTCTCTCGGWISPLIAAEGRPSNHRIPYIISTYYTSYLPMVRATSLRYIAPPSPPTTAFESNTALLHSRGSRTIRHHHPPHQSPTSAMRITVSS